MRRLVLLVAAVLAAAVAAGTVPAATTLGLRLSTTRAGAAHVALTLKFQAALRCGVPVGGIAVTLPRAARVPARIDVSALRVNGHPPLDVVVRGRAITILSGRLGTTCYSIVDGNAVVTISAAAGIGNPAKPGPYPVTVTHGGERFSGIARIS